MKTFLNIKNNIKNLDRETKIDIISLSISYIVNLTAIYFYYKYLLTI